jgi:hypothetical protein
MNFQWLTIVGNCPVEHYHLNDPTCYPGGSGNEPGAQNGPHRHEGSATCHKEPCCGKRVTRPGACMRPHHHVGDPSWRPPA